MYDNIWLKRVWIPFWIIQLLFVIVLLASIGLGFSLIRNSKDDLADDLQDEGVDSSDFHHAYSAVSAILGVWIAICALTIIFDVVEIVLYARKRLSPVVAVVLNSLATLVWGVLFIMACIGAGRGGTALGLIWLIVIFAITLGKLIYTSVVLHRFRRARRSRGAYTPAQAHAEAGLDPGYTAYNPAGAPPNPFRDPSRDPSPAGRPHGAATEYYTPAIEMQQQQSQRYYG